MLLNTDFNTNKFFARKDVSTKFKLAVIKRCDKSFDFDTHNYDEEHLFKMVLQNNYFDYNITVDDLPISFDKYVNAAIWTTIKNIPARNSSYAQFVNYCKILSRILEGYTPSYKP